MGYFQAVILGLVQGAAEFLPISSSGHLAMLQYFFGIDASDALLFTVMLHIGTLISVFIMYRKDILDLIVELGLTIRDLATGKGLRLDERPVRKLGVMIIVASVPTALIGVLLNDFFESLYGNIIFIGVGFLITGAMLFVSERVSTSRNGIEKMNFRNALFIGTMQGVAIYPGISRSGSTLVAGLFAGLKREFAVKFAFLISIPSILGSALLEGRHLFDGSAGDVSLGPVVAGMVVAAVSGIAAIKIMIRIVSDKKLKYFAYYVFALGVFVVGYGLFNA